MRRICRILVCMVAIAMASTAGVWVYSHLVDYQEFRFDVGRLRFVRERVDVWAIGASIWPGYIALEASRASAEEFLVFVGPVRLAWILLVEAMLLAVVLRLRRTANTSGSCQRCAYDLTGNVSGACPECATPIAGHNSVPQGGSKVEPTSPCPGNRPDAKPEQEKD